MQYYRKRPSKIKKFFSCIIYLIVIIALANFFFPEYLSKYTYLWTYDYEKRLLPDNKTKDVPKEVIASIKEVVSSEPQKIIDLKKTFTTTSNYSKEYLNVAYKNAEVKLPNETIKKDLILNIYKPENVNHKTPAIVFIPGENFSLNKDNSLNSLLYKKIKELTSKGITVINVEYRDISEAKFPTQIFDLKDSIKFLKANSEKYGIDSDKIAVVGENTGGTFAQLLGTTNSNPKFEENIVTTGENASSSSINYVVTFGSPTDITTLFIDSDKSLIPTDKAYTIFDAADSVYGKIIDFNTERWMGMAGIRRMQKKGKELSSNFYWNRVLLAEMLSPINSVSKNSVPMFIVHNSNDKNIPVKQSNKLAAKLNENKIENIFICNYSNNGNYADENVINLSLNWLVEKLSK